MTDLVVTSSTVDALLRLTPLAVEEPCPVVHHFGPGIYIREVTLPAGALVVGKTHRHAHMNLMLRGKLELHDEATGANRVLEAPQMFVSPPGRKVARIIDTVVWHNVYATEERDIEKLEAWLFEPERRDVDVFELHRQLRQPERDDYAEFATGNPWWTGDVVEGDDADFPTGYASGPDDYIAKGLQAYEKFKGEKLLQFTSSPHAPYTVSDENFVKLRDLAEKYDMVMHCHIPP